MNVSSTSYLSLPNAERFRHRTTSLPEGHDRYVSIGGFVDIQELTKKYGRTKINKSKQQYGLFGSVSPRSRILRNSCASSSSEDVENQGWESVPTSPCRHGKWPGPQTPETPFAGSKQINNLHFHRQSADNILPPRTPKSNRYDHDLCLNISPCSRQLLEAELQVRPSETVPGHSVQYMPLELAGSLLLPSQGFPQSNPPEIPPRMHERSHSAPATSTRISPIACENVGSLATPTTLITDYSHLSRTLSPPTSTMRKQSHQRDTSCSTPILEQSTKNTLPARKSSLRSRMGPPRYGPRIPLSHMQLEELMQILPTLDAAIIAHDWIPCMQKRHQELKNSLEKMQLTQASEPSLDFLNKVRPTSSPPCH